MEEGLSAALDPHSSGRRGAGCDGQGPATVFVGRLGRVPSLASSWARLLSELSHNLHVLRSE